MSGNGYIEHPYFKSSNEYIIENMEQSKVDKQFNEIVNGQDRPVLTERMKRIYDAAADVELYETIVERDRAEIANTLILNRTDHEISEEELHRANLNFGTMLHTLMRKYDLPLNDAIKASEICYEEYMRRANQKY